MGFADAVREWLNPTPIPPPCWSPYCCDDHVVIRLYRWGGYDEHNDPACECVHCAAYHSLRFARNAVEAAITIERRPGTVRSTHACLDLLAAIFGTPGRSCLYRGGRHQHGPDDLDMLPVEFRLIAKGYSAPE